MTVLDVFLAEAPFPSKKPAVGAAPKPKPAGAGAPPKAPKPGAAPAPGGPAGPGDEEGQDAILPPGASMMGGGDNSDAIMALQQAKDEKEAEEAAQAAQQEAIAQAERDRIKELRAQADEKVASDLASKFNDQPDQVVWYPSVDAILYGGTDEEGADDEKDGFAGHLDKKMGLKKDGEDEDGSEADDADEISDEDASEEEVAKKPAEDDEDDSTPKQKPVKDDMKDPERLSEKKPKPNKRPSDVIIKV